MNMLYSDLLWDTRKFQGNQAEFNKFYVENNTILLQCTFESLYQMKFRQV